jgi:hypothetical protein
MFSQNGKFRRSFITTESYNIFTVDSQNNLWMGIAAKPLVKYDVSKNTLVSGQPINSNNLPNGSISLAIDGFDRMYVLENQVDKSETNCKAFISIFDNKASFLAKWSVGAMQGYGCEAERLTVNRQGFLYFTQGVDLIRKYDSAGQFVLTFKTKCSASSLIIDAEGNIYAQNSGADVEVYNKNGQPLYVFNYTDIPEEFWQIMAGLGLILGVSCFIQGIKLVNRFLF